MSHAQPVVCCWVVPPIKSFVYPICPESSLHERRTFREHKHIYLNTDKRAVLRAGIPTHDKHDTELFSASSYTHTTPHTIFSGTSESYFTARCSELRCCIHTVSFGQFEFQVRLFALRLPRNARSCWCPTREIWRQRNSQVSDPLVQHP